VAVKSGTVRAPDKLVGWSGIADATGRILYPDPSCGLMAWTREQVTNHARYLFVKHRPDLAIIRVRIVWGVIPLIVWSGLRCRACHTRWPCQTNLWARTRLPDAPLGQRWRSRSAVE
jgi:hypothetical protein